MKKLSAVFLCLMLSVLAVFMPMSVLADDAAPADSAKTLNSVVAGKATSVKIWGLTLDSATEYYHNGNGGTLGAVTDVEANHNAHYDPSTGTLELNGLEVWEFDNSTNGALSADGDITIVLNAISRIYTDSSAKVDTYGVYIDGSLTVRGSGTLAATSGTTVAQGCGVWTSGGITAKSGTLTGTGGASVKKVPGGSYGVHAGGRITADGGTIEGNGGGLAEISGESSGVCAEQGISITVNGGSIIGTASTTRYGKNYGIRVLNGGITINGGSITGTGFHGGESFGVYAANANIKVSGGSITGTGSLASYNSYGVYAVNCNIEACGGKITGTGDKIYATDGSSCGVYADTGNIEASSGSIGGTGGNATTEGSSSYGVYSHSGSITASGGSIKGTGGAAENYSYGVCSGGYSVTASGTNSIIEGTGVEAGNSCGVYAYKSIKAEAGGSIAGTGGKASLSSGDSVGVWASGQDLAIASIGTTSSITGIGGTSGRNSFGVLTPGTISIANGAKTLAQGNSQALSCLEPPNLNGSAAAASITFNDLNPGLYDASDWTTYKLFRTPATLSAPQLTITPLSSFIHGQAPDNETVTVNSTSDTNFSAARYFGSATVDGAPIDLGQVGTPGTAGSVENGSIVIRLNKTYLNGLSVGAHTLIVNLKGIYTGHTAQCTLTVTSAPTVTAVMVNPAMVNIQKGGTQTFSANILGANDPAQTVTWTVSGGVTGTSIDADGVLTVAAKEKAATLTVKASSTVNTAKSGTATVTVIKAESIEHEITKGQNWKWAKGSDGSLGFTADAEYSKFTGVSVDGTAVSGDKYTSQSGSTIVTLKPVYLQTLSVGRHTLRINFTDGYAETGFTIKAETDNPQMGDDSMLWLCIGTVAAAGLAVSLTLVIRRKRQNG